MWPYQVINEPEPQAAAHLAQKCSPCQLHNMTMLARSAATHLAAILRCKTTSPDLRAKAQQLFRIARVSCRVAVRALHS